MNSEGGPVLCMDMQAARYWNGNKGSESDYCKLCETLENTPGFSSMTLTIRGLGMVVWEPHGSGTIDAFVDRNGDIVFVRSWLSGCESNEVEVLAVHEPIAREVIGTMELQSGGLAILWAPESGSNMPDAVSEDVTLVHNTILERSVYIIKRPIGTLSFAIESVQLGNSQAQRLCVQQL